MAEEQLQTSVHSDPQTQSKADSGAKADPAAANGHAKGHRNGSNGKGYRLDGELHDKLMKPRESSLVDLDISGPGLPDPVYPQLPEDFRRSKKEYQRLNALRTAKAWALPYAKSLWHRNELRPLIAYLFTEWKCNLACEYCWAFENSVPGMTEEVARKSIDWLESIGCRVLALMGGEPLLRPDFIHKVTYYAAKKGFFVYLPTNGRLMKPEVIDKLGDAGLAAVNLAVDAVDEKPGLPKALTPIRPYFDYLVKTQNRYGHLVMLNINITRINIEDARQLTEIGRANDVGTDYHINEAPLIEQEHFGDKAEVNSTYLRPEDYPKVDALLDELKEKQRQGYKMANPIQHLEDMKQLMRGHVEPWPCRAGKNTMIIRTDGTLAPCFPMYSASHDWGTVGNHKFEDGQLTEMKKSCNSHCLSTCNYILGYSYNAKRVISWGLKQARHGFRGATGAFE
ncbi:MAG TPA: radical SAM/SPASM domain-containing protein [Acidobacteriota bacterium]|nr:radical SAM/SPASM domain-containing protein [Acidobacteriota bacterium]